jgi:hypothetical protein
VSDKISYPVPWDRVFGLTPHIANGTRENLDAFTGAIVNRMQPPPALEGLELLPESPRFLLVANHYQRKGLWILHSASVLTQAIRQRYGPGDPPVRWLVTANWPPWRIGPWKFASPGDWLLPKVAHALHCYPVSFAGANPAFTAASLRRVLRDADRVDRPIGIFPEGVAGSAGVLTDPLPGVDRLVRQLARRGLPAVPAGISEAGRFVIRFGSPVASAELLAAPDAARLLMSRIAALLR